MPASLTKLSEPTEPHLCLPHREWMLSGSGPARWIAEHSSRHRRCHRPGPNLPIYGESSEGDDGSRTSDLRLGKPRGGHTDSRRPTTDVDETGRVAGDSASRAPEPRKSRSVPVAGVVALFWRRPLAPKPRFGPRSARASRSSPTCDVASSTAPTEPRDWTCTKTPRFVGFSQPRPERFELPTFGSVSLADRHDLSHRRPRKPPICTHSWG
jgi:hypothetical protein